MEILIKLEKDAKTKFHLYGFQCICSISKNANDLFLDICFTPFYSEIMFQVILKHNSNNFNENHHLGLYRTFWYKPKNRGTITSFISLYEFQNNSKFLDDQNQLHFLIDIQHPLITTVWNSWEFIEIISFIQYLPEEVLIDCIEIIFCLK